MGTFFDIALTKIASATDGLSGLYEPTADLESDISKLAIRTVSIAAFSLVVLIVIAALTSERIPSLKAPLFILIAITMGGSTLLLSGTTVYLNVKADSGGPVHWHADIEYWACGNQLELRDPTGFLSNKIGTATLHEHDDRRIHLEGVVVDGEHDASLGKFMHVIGGGITREGLVVPLNDEGVGPTFENDVDGDGPSDSHAELIKNNLVEDQNGRFARFLSGQSCGDQEAEVQVFVYSVDEASKTYEQFKLRDPAKYVIADDPNVPPGDCVIFEFDAPKEKTDKLCEQFGVRDKERCEAYGVEASKRSICEYTQINYKSDVEYTTDNKDAENITETLEEIRQNSAETGLLDDVDIEAIESVQDEDIFTLCLTIRQQLASKVSEEELALLDCNQIAIAGDE